MSWYYTLYRQVARSAIYKQTHNFGFRDKPPAYIRILNKRIQN